MSVGDSPEGSVLAVRGCFASKGLGTDGNTLIRVVVFRFKIDILDIGRELLTMYGKSLYSFIKVNLLILDTKSGICCVLLRG